MTRGTRPLGTRRTSRVGDPYKLIVFAMNNDLQELITNVLLRKIAEWQIELDTDDLLSLRDDLFVTLSQTFVWFRKQRTD
jgi:hypothetical protein